MKRLLLGLAVAVGLAGLVLSADNALPTLDARGEFRAERADKNPWTHLRLNNDPREFRFILVSDRTGGHRPKIFSRAVEQINLLQPEFVLSVGDLIEGYTEDRARLDREWREFNSFVERLQMPFFYVPGNHDVQNGLQTQLWNERFGRTYYYFVYKDVLFLLMNSDDNPPGKKGTNIQPEQVAYFKKVLAEHTQVRWTFVAIHKPVWTDADAEKLGWFELEKALADRPYTVFAGHVHRYEKFVRQGRNYYQFATTGGGSKLRGERYGEFDHVVQVSMKDKGPIIANIMLDGVLPEDLTNIPSDEPGVDTSSRKPCESVRGKVLYRGQPIADAQVVFWGTDPRTGRPRRVGDALTDTEGRFVLSTYTANDGAPVGEYKVSVIWTSAPTDFNNRHRPNRLPKKYADVAKSGLTATVKAGENDFLFNLTEE